MAVTIGSVSIGNNPSYQSENWPVRYNQYSVETADAGFPTIDNGPTLVKGLLAVVNISKAEKNSLQTYLTDTAVFSLNAFVISPPASTDLGKGDGQDITVYYDGPPTLKGVFKFKKPGYYNLRLPYREAL